MDLAENNTGWDKTPMPMPDYDVNKVPDWGRRLANYQRTKWDGNDVLESIAQGTEYTALVSEEAKDIAEETQLRQDAVEQFNEQMIVEMTRKDVISAPELIQMRKSAPTAGSRIQRDLEIQGYSAWWWGVVADGETDDTLALQLAIDEISGREVNLHIDGDIKLTRPITLRSGVTLSFKGSIILDLNDWNNSPSNYVISVPETSKVGIYGLKVNGLAWGEGVINAPLILSVAKDCEVDINGVKFENFDLDIRNQQYVFMTYKDGLKGSIKDIYMQNIRALGDEGISDDSGAIRLAKFEYTGVAIPSDFVMEKIRVVNFGNRSTVGATMEEDADLIHFFSPAVGNSVLFKDIKLFNSGKRAIKVQLTNGVDIEDIEFYNHGTDRMSYAISVLNSSDVNIKNIKFNGKIQRGIEISNSNKVSVDGISGRAVELDNYFTDQFSLLWISNSKELNFKNITGDWHCVLRLYGNTEKVFFENFLCTAHVISLNVYTNSGDVIKMLKFNNVNISKKKADYSISNKPTVHFNNNAGTLEDVSFVDSYLELTAEYSYGGILFNQVKNLSVNGLIIKPMENLFNRVLTLWNCTGLLVALQGRDPYAEDFYAEVKTGANLEFVNCAIGKKFELNGATTNVILTRTDSVVYYAGGASGANVTNYNSKIV